MTGQLATPALTLARVEVRSVVVPLRRPVVSKVGSFEDWPLILVDLYTDQDVVGRSYLEPYLTESLGYLVPAIQAIAAGRQGQPINPLEDYQRSRRATNLVGYEGIALIAISGLDMAAWDALAKAADLPLARLLGGTVGSVPAYNSNGLWLNHPLTLGQEAAELVDEGGFQALKLRLGRPRLADDLRAIEAVRGTVGSEVDLMVDFNQGMALGEALHRCHGLDDQGLYWFEEPVAYNDLRGCAQLAWELRTPVQLGENFYAPRSCGERSRRGPVTW
jgi:mandelate racemase